MTVKHLSSISSKEASAIFVTGAPRSGTSWLGEMLAACSKVRYVYEPFNFQWSPRLETQLPHFKYLRPGAPAPSLVQLSGGQAFRGEQTPKQLLRSAYRGYWRSSFGRYDKVLVKDPTAVLMADWIEHEYSAQIVSIIRHPCGFASSILPLGWDLSLKRFLRQKHLVQDYFKEYENLLVRVSKVSDPWVKAGALWSVINTVVLQRHKSNGRIICKYEDLCENPLSAMKELTQMLKLESDISKISDSREGVTSSTANDAGSTARDSQQMASIWMSRMTDQQINTVMGVVSEFGLARYYPETS